MRTFAGLPAIDGLMHLNPSPEGPPSPIAQCRITYRMTDQMGIVYYGNYMEMFEMGRTQLLKVSGFSYRDMESEGYRLAVVHASCDYLQPALYDDLIEIETRVERLTRARVNFTYEIRRPHDATVLARGVTHHVYLSPEGRLRRLEPHWMERLKAITQYTPNGAQPDS
jgi:acyl-CoA thioester hydrolase